MTWLDVSSPPNFPLFKILIGPFFGMRDFYVYNIKGFCEPLNWWFNALVVYVMILLPLSVAFAAVSTLITLFLMTGMLPPKAEDEFIP